MITTEIKLFDTKSRQLQPLILSDDKKLRIYSCGPTVYRDAHVGNMRTFLLGDLVTRLAKFVGYKVEFIQNITDVGHMSEDFVEDKMLAQAKAESKDPFEIARIYEKRFHEDLKRLNIEPANIYPKASECINLMQELIQKLIDSDHAYLGTDNCVYFSAQSFPGYGAISGNRLDALKPGHRFEYTEDGAKRFHADWALWKAAGDRTEMIWDSPWGKGFPGWHIECSAMSLHYLDNFVDLHLGGIDLRFPHHENERAQSIAAINKEAVALWIHGEHLLFESRKMSKSAANVVLVSDLIDKHLDPLSLRVCFLENRYRSQMDLSWDSLKAAHILIQRWREKITLWQHDKKIDLEQVKKLVDEIVLDFNLL
jgi:cysteinyl-tRNA synthetase